MGAGDLTFGTEGRTGMVVFASSAAVVAVEETIWGPISEIAETNKSIVLIANSPRTAL
jgi:hypothetical protein